MHSSPTGFLPIVREQPLGLDLRPIYQAAIPRRPLQFPTLDAFCDVAWGAIVRDAETRGLSPLTLRWWEQSLRVFAQFLRASGEESAFLSGDVDMQLGVIDRWVHVLRTERKVSHTTVHTYFGAMHAICRRVERTHGMVNPFALLIPPARGRSRRPVLTREQAERLISTITHYRWRSALLRARNLAVVGLMLYAGLRRGEVLRLKAGDLHIVEGWVAIRRGKGTAGGKPRTAYLPPQLREILALYLKERDTAKPRRTHPELITTVEANAPASVMTIKRLFERLSAIGGLHVSPHMLRHTYATLLRQAGVADRISMDFLGHTSLGMLTRYSHVFDPEYEMESRKLHLDVDLPLPEA